MRGRIAKCMLALSLAGAVTLSGMWIPEAEVKAAPPNWLNTDKSVSGYDKVPYGELTSYALNSKNNSNVDQTKITNGDASNSDPTHAANRWHNNAGTDAANGPNAEGTVSQLSGTGTYVTNMTGNNYIIITLANATNVAGITYAPRADAQYNGTFKNISVYTSTTESEDDFGDPVAANVELLYKDDISTSGLTNGDNAKRRDMEILFDSAKDSVKRVKIVVHSSYQESTGKCCISAQEIGVIKTSDISKNITVNVDFGDGSVASADDKIVLDAVYGPSSGVDNGNCKIERVLPAGSSCQVSSKAGFTLTAPEITDCKFDGWLVGNDAQVTTTEKAMTVNADSLTADTTYTAKYTKLQTDKIIEAPVVEFTKAPVLGDDIGNYKDIATPTSDKCTVGSMMWIKGDNPDDSSGFIINPSGVKFEKYKPYLVCVSLSAVGDYVFADSSIPTSVNVAGGKTATVVRSNMYSEKSLLLYVRFDDLMADYSTEKLFFYPSATGDSASIKDQNGVDVTSEEAMDFLNGMTDITVTTMVKYTSAEEDKHYALFTLEDGNGKYFTAWHRPQGEPSLCYAYRDGNYASIPGTVFKNGVADYFKVEPTDHGWHKVYLSLTGPINNRAQIRMGLDDRSILAKDVASSGEMHFNTSIFTGKYTTATVGKKASAGAYSLSVVDLGDAGEIKYVEVTGKQYADNAANSFKEEKTEFTKDVVTEFNSNRDLCFGVKEGDFRKDSWDEFKATLESIGDITATTEAQTLGNEWACCDAIDKMKEATSKLTVCIHNYVNGTCTECGSTAIPEEKYTVTVYKGDSVDESKNLANVSYGDICTVTADADNNGSTFSYWTNKKDGKPISYNLEYGFYVTKNMELYAVYGGEAKNEPAITLSNMYSKEVNKVKRVYFETTRNVPVNYTVVGHGILYCVDSTVANESNMTVDTDTMNPTTSAVRSYKGEKLGNNGVLTFSGRVGDNNVEKPIYVRGYVVVKDAEGKTSVYYTDVENGTYNNLQK